MKRSSFPLVFLLLAATLLPGRGVEFGAYLDGVFPGDNLLKEIYGNSPEMEFGLTAGIPIWNGFSLRLAAGHFQRNGETSYTGEVSRLRLYPLAMELRYALGRGGVRPYVQAGYVHLIIRETAGIGEYKEQRGGPALSVGTEFSLSSRFHFECRVRYTDVRVPGPLDASIQMGGLSAGFAFLVHL